eukprot:CAMPEP_0194202132 /NCGR_PEP_ID=MMETSP0156-20130528/2239_1 /TAXON_ID=33649 /ORGANISM="Thalassionema nitzschioides, Strain L26-B" /LENGTH=545 /DNA_ID=CAMNT_0038927535 /DNA_START=73 /DNA_END=1710 /DNA_ORIENTATION=+
MIKSLFFFVVVVALYSVAYCATGLEDNNNNNRKKRRNLFNYLVKNSDCTRWQNSQYTTWSKLCDEGYFDSTTAPSSAPSITPMPSITASPTYPYPTLAPSPNPSEMPSESTPVPSDTPSVAPINPTLYPTASPIPTPAPSVTPTATPTNRPSSTPTISTFPTGDFPTESPAPTPAPSESPTGPSASPSHQPSTTPSGLAPTLFPTSSPKPSPAPSSAPTNSPPTASPSRSFPPSAHPTSSPTGNPTLSPSQYPSTTPTAEPTGDPTPSPSSAPSTSQPSGLPSRSVLPTPVPQNCDDSRTGTFLVETTSGTIKQERCVWLETRPTQQPTYCQPGQDAYHLCPETCGVCDDTCEDTNGSFVYDGTHRDCTWLKLRLNVMEEVCLEGRTAHDVTCPETCNACDVPPPDPTLQPTNYPTTSPSTPFPSSFPTVELPCDDDRDATFLRINIDNNGSTEEERNCAWLAFSATAAEQELYCSSSAIATDCRETCGLCLDDCEDITNGTFLYLGEDRDCPWLATQNTVQDVICREGFTAYDIICPETCNKCD